MVCWNKLVWEQQSLPWHNLVLWLAVIGKLKAKDRLSFLDPNTTCVLCSQGEDSHGHLFFACTWASSIWTKIRSWLRITRRMSTLNSALKGLKSCRNGLEFRMRRVSLAIVVYLIWQERNKRVFDSNCSSVDHMFRKFQIQFYTIFYFHEKRPFSYWCWLACLLLQVAVCRWYVCFCHLLVLLLLGSHFPAASPNGKVGELSLPYYSPDGLSFRLCILSQLLVMCLYCIFTFRIAGLISTPSILVWFHP